jgi:uncharacterized protein YjbI with pentapeptide repeats
MMATPSRTGLIKDSQFNKRDFSEPENFTECCFEKPADFSEATFHAAANFHRVNFSHGANFKGAVFEQGASFTDCTFAWARFSLSQFWYQAWFWKSLFKGEVDFSHATIRKGQTPHKRITDNGRANFSWCRFEGDTNLSQLWIEGPAFFWGTRFLTKANLYALRFEAGAHFEGTPWRVCVSRQEIPECFDELLKIGVLHPDAEWIGPRTMYANFIGVQTAEQLVSKLNQHLPPDAIERVRRLWMDLAQPMFSNQLVNFSGMSAADASSVRFSGVNLSRAMLADSAIAAAQFDDVEWDTRKMFATHRRRSAIWDEGAAREPQQFAAVGRFYHDVRVSYERKNQSELAGDFYYGEIEMRRRSQPWFIRSISLAAWFKYLSGYGENYVLSLIWLAVFVLLLCPGLYVAAGFARGDPVRSLLHSLEVVTFLKEPNQATPEIVAVRVIEGFERVLVALQLGLFLLGIKRKFMRA